MIAFKVFQLCPVEQRPSDVPLAMPWVQQTCTEENTDFLRKQGWSVMTDEEYSEYVATVETADVPIPVVSPRQFRTALILSGVMIGDVEAALSTLPEPQKSLALTAWEYATEFNRINPTFDIAKELLGVTDEYLDDLFRLAVTL